MISAGIIGSGAWGTTLALLLAKQGIATTLWEHRSERASEMQHTRVNDMFLPGITFPDALQVTASIAEATRQKDLLILVTPSQRLRHNLRLLAPYLEAHTMLVSASKGIEIESLCRMTEVIEEEIPQSRERLAALSGPNLSKEVAQGMPTAAVVAAYNYDIALKVRTILSCDTFRIYTSHDVIGVELGGALKNIIAIGAGINDGLGYGENAKAAIITRGLAEISRLGIAAGANPLTFSGLAGMGDLVATCTSQLSRNQRLGRRIGMGEKLDTILSSTHTVSEGVYTTRAALRLAQRYNVEMPITSQISQILFEGLEPSKAVPELMSRDLKYELAGITPEESTSSSAKHRK
jgi:Glycerol-3-phosphate dehydrogenase